MAADGTINIDVLINKTKFLPDYQEIKKMLTNLGDGSGDKMDQSFERNSNKMVQDAKSAHENVKTIANDAVTQHIKADVSDLKSKESLATRFKRLFKHPVVTDIKADTNDTKAKFKAVERAKNEVKKPVMVKVNADTSGFRSGISSVMGHMREVRDQSSKTKHILSGAFGGALLANVATNAWSAITSHIGQAADAVVEYNDKQQLMNATWHTLTGSVKEGKGMVDMVNDMSTALGQDVDVTDELAQQFYHVYDNKPQTEQLTKSFLIMGDAIGMSGDRLKQVGLDFTHTMSSGLLQLGDFNQISDAFPMYGNALLDYERKLQNNTALTMSELRKQMSAGKISAQDAATVLNNLGAKYKDSAENIMGTLPGMARKLKSQLPKIMNEMAEPILNARNPIVAQVSSWSSDPKTDQTFKALGDKVGNSMNDVMTQFGKEFSGDGNPSDNLNKWVEDFGNKVSKSLEWVADHAHAITTIFESAGSIGKSLSIGYIETLGWLFGKLVGAKGDGVNAIADGLERLSKHQKAIEVIGGTMATFWIASKATGFLINIQKSIKSLDELKTAIFGVKKAKEEANSVDMAEDLSSDTKSVQSKAVTRTSTATAEIEPQIKPQSTSKLSALGLSWGKVIGYGMSGAIAGMDIFSALTAKSKSQKVKSIGGSIGSVIGLGIGATLGGAPGAMLGATIGDQLGKTAAPRFQKWLYQKPKTNNQKIKSTKQEMSDMQHMLATPDTSASERAHYAKTIEEDKKKLKELENQAKKTKKATDSVGTSKKKTTTAKAITAVATTHVTKTDISNVKAMIPAIKSYEDALSGLKTFLKKNSPAGELSKIDKSIQGSNKSWSKLSKPIEKIGSSFKKLSSFSKSMSKDDAFSKLNTDLSDLDKTLGKSKVDTHLNDMAKSLKKNKLSSEFNKINDSSGKLNKGLTKLDKPLIQVKKSFQTLLSFNKSLGKKDAFSQLNTDVTNLDSTLSKSKFTTYLNQMASSLKKNKLSSELDGMNKSIKTSASTWVKLDKPVKNIAKDFQEISSFSKTFQKSDPFAQVNTDVTNLYKTLKTYDIGSMLQKQISTANTATKGSKFASQFTTQTNQIITNLRSFKKTFNSDWRDLWDDASSDEKNKIGKLSSEFSSETGKISARETKFTSSFLDNWSSWLSSLTSAFKSAFNSLPSIASSDMSKVVAQINKGIGSVNSVITAFGGKSLSLAHYATGTSGTSGGLAVVGEQGYELAFDKKNGIYPVGTNGEEIRQLEADTAILPHHMSTTFMSMVNSLPHHATGKGDPSQVSDDMMTYIIDHIDTLKKDPVPLLKKEFFKTAKFDGNEFNIKFGNALSNGFLKAIAGPFKKQLADMDFSMGGNYNPKMILAAAAMMKVHPSAQFVKMLQAVIQSESGGRNIMQQIQDSNSGANAAGGILQYTPGTFNAFAFGNHRNRMNPFDELLAFFNNSDWEHSIGPTSIWGVSKIDWLHSGPQGHRRFGNGGWSDQEAIFGEVPGEPEVAINPNRDSADRLIMEAIQKRIEKNPNGTMAKAMNTIHNAKTQAHEFVGKGIANVKNTVANGQASIANIKGDITSNIYLDGQQIAKTTYPIYKAMQSKEISVQTKKGGLH